MKIKVTNPLAVRVAQAATSKQDFQKVFQGILIRPDGSVTGSDGFVLAHHPRAVEPFEGEAFIARLQAPLPKSAEDIEFDTDAQIVRYQVRKRDGASEPCAMAYTVIEGAYPDPNTVIPTEGRVWSGSNFGFDLSLVRRLWAVANSASNDVTVQFTEKQVVRLVHWDEDLVMVLMPLRRSHEGLPGDLPLPVVEEVAA